MTNRPTQAIAARCSDCGTVHELATRLDIRKCPACGGSIFKAEQAVHSTVVKIDIRAIYAGLKQ
jgi:predicted  nucleic acid-binding Zn-ribbon protein